jgi:hypothetical protein
MFSLQPPHQRSPSFSTGGGAKGVFDAAALTIDNTEYKDLVNKLPKVIVNSNQPLQVTPTSSRKWPGVCVLTGLGAFCVGFLNDAPIGKSIGIGLVAGATLFSLVRGSQKYFNATADKPVKTLSEEIVLPGQHEMPEVRIPCGVRSKTSDAIPHPHERQIDEGGVVWFYTKEDVEEYNSNKGYALLTDETQPRFQELQSLPANLTVATSAVYFHNLVIYTRYLPVSFDTRHTFPSALKAQEAFMTALQQRETLVQNALPKFQTGK